MKHRQYYYHFFLFLLTISCNNTQKIKNNIFDIDIRDAFANSLHIPLSKIASNIDFIFLESKEESLISSLGGLIYDESNNLLIIKDKLLNRVIIFNSEGKFLSNIHSIGEAPFEYKAIKSFCYSKIEKQIFILDNIQKKILVFSIDGNFINYFKTPRDINIQKIFVIDNKIVAFISKPFIVRNNYYSFIVFDLKGKIIKKFGKWPKYCCEMKDMAPGNRFYSFKNNYYLKETNNDTVYRISQDYSFYPVCRIIANDNPTEPTELNNMNKFMKWLINHNEFSSLIETNNYLFLNGTHNLYKSNIWYQKKTKKSFQVLFDFDIYDFGFYDNISGGMPFWPSGKINDNTLYQIVEPTKLQEVISSNFYDTVNIQNLQQHKKLIEFVKKTTLETNPIIAIVKLK